MNQLEGKVALITGAAGGIGRATSKLFIDEGVKGLVMVDIWDEMGEKMAAQLGSNAIYIHGDVSRENDIKKSINLAMDRFDQLDIVFSNAGNTGPGGNIEDVPTNEFDLTMAIHLRAAFLYMKHAIPLMKKQESGCFILTSSVAGYQQGMGGLAYSLSKAALIHLARIAAVELGIFGIRANAIAPGFVATGIFGAGMALSHDGREKLANFMKNFPTDTQAIRRAGVPEDVANVALFLASDSSSFITGITLLVDGGLLSGRIPQDPNEGENTWDEMIRDLNPTDQKILEFIINTSDNKVIERLSFYKPYSIITSTLLKRIEEKGKPSKKE
ncbi:MAG: SDR family NAD(P)-dependent oxidoreductase [Promethearchaeota archaeon]